MDKDWIERGPREIMGMVRVELEGGMREGDWDG